MSFAAAIPAAIGVASQLGLFGKGAKEGKKVEYEAQAPEYQQKFAEDFFKYLQGTIGQGATPYGGQVAAPFQNPFTTGAYGAMKASPYGSMMGDMPMGGAPFVPPQPQPPQPPMPRQGGMGLEKQPGRGVPFPRGTPFQRGDPSQGGGGLPGAKPLKRFLR